MKFLELFFMKNYMKNFTSQAEAENGKPRLEVGGNK